MKSLQRILLAALALSTATLALLVWRQQQELEALHKVSTGQAIARDEDMERKLAASQANVQELERQLAEARAPKASAKAEGRTTGNPAAFMPELASFFDRPEMQRMMSAQEKALTDRRYDRLFKLLKLSPEQLEKFKALLAERQAVPRESMLVAAQQGINPMTNQDELQRMVAASQKELDQQIHGLLGETDYAHYEDYQRLEPVRATVGQLQQGLSFNDEPMTKVQVSQLVDVIAETRSPSGADGGKGSLISDTAILRSQSFLSPSQVQSLQTLQQQQQSNAKLQGLFRSGARTRPGPP